MAGERYTQIEALIGQEPHLSEDGPGIAGGMRRLCSAASRALGARGAGLSVMADDGLRGMSAASDEDTGRLEEMQFTFGEGPCIDAFDSQRPVLISDLGGPAMIRWPACAPAMFARGVRAVFAFPLQVGAARLGMLDVFRSQPGMLSPGELATALTFAEVAVATLVDGLGHSGSGEPAAWLADPLGSRAQLFQAQGMVMVQLRVPLATAMARMRAYAFAHDMPLGQIAADIVARQISFEQDSS